MRFEIILISLLIVILLGLIAGGIFIWQYDKVYPPSQSAEEESNQIFLREEPVEETTEQETTTDAVVSEIEEKVQTIIEQSRELIAEAQEFLAEEKEKTALREAAQKKSSQVKGVYMNEFIASSQSAAALNTRQKIKDLLQETELNAVVIDVKEAYGPSLPNSLRILVDELHEQDAWVIARICAFRDVSLIEKSPELYLKTIIHSTSSQATSTEEIATSTETFWQDAGRGYWLDPASQAVQDYLIEFSKQVIDFGFDELQFDYIRFPSDGDIENIIYPFFNEEQKKYEVIKEFFLKVTDALRDYKSDIILSVDLFGYVATQYQSLDIGQRIVDAAETFDYLSFMLYPSHFYGGFSVPENLKRGLPAVYFPYEDETTTSTDHLVSANPYQVILRSVFVAADYLALFKSQAHIRPWLQDFNLGFDMSRGIYYDAEKIKAQIQGAEDAGTSGWLLWNPSNIYTAEALEK